MAIQDQNRSRKVYSFFRAAPVPLPVTGETDLLFFNNIGELSAYDANALSSGKMAFVRSVRDYFFIEKLVNSGSTDSVQDIQANGFAGVWHRMGLGGPYWKNQRFWWIDAETGNDENLGAFDVPLKTLDELVRRLFGVQKIRSDYTVILTSVTRSIDNTYGLDVEFDGGSIIFQGAPKFSASIGTIGSIAGDVNYASARGPTVFFDGTGSVGNNLLYASGSGGATVIGWALDGDDGAVYTTAFTGAVGSQLYQAASPRINTPGFMSRGQGRLVLSGVLLGVSGNSGLVVGGDASAPITFMLSSMESNSPELAGGFVTFDRSRLRSTSGSILIHNETRVYGSGSGFVTPRQQINLRDCHFEQGASSFWNSAVQVRKSQVVLSIVGVSGSALMSSTLEVQSDSQIDVRNLIASKTNGLPWPLLVTGQDVSVFYDDVNTPKANSIAVNNGFAQNFTWAQMPYLDMMRNTKIVSGALQSILGGGDGSY